MECGDIGSYNGPPDEFVQFVIDIDPSGQCQQVKVGTTSPGPVLDEEFVARFVFAPAHLKTTGEIDESLISDAFIRGASINRVQNAWNEAVPELHAKGEAHAETIRIGNERRPPQPNRRYLGFIQVQTADVRASKVDEVPARVRVYDTSLIDDNLHADIIANGQNLTKSLKKGLKTLLYLKVVKSGLFLSPHLQGGMDLDTLGIPVHAP